MSSLSCKQAREIDLVDYLFGLGHAPVKVRASDYWFRSPFREERTASFKVNRTKNVWFDFGEGVGGNIIDFGTKYFKCSVKTFLEILSDEKGIDFSFHPHFMAAEKKDAQSSKIIIVKEEPLASKALLTYLQERCIPFDIANKSCREITFQLNGKEWFAIGFKNDKGGFELRNKNFKGSSSPKGITFINHNTTQLSVLEGFFDFLSFQTLKQNVNANDTSFLILNSLSFFSQSKDLMDKYQAVNLYLDKNKKGIECTNLALQWDNKKYIDHSKFLRHGQDLNDFLVERNLKGQRLIVKVKSGQKNKGRRL